jgi:N-formylglutamate amidohydrolase
MDKQVNQAFDLDRPSSQTIPFVFSSPHSGTNYLESFITSSKLNLLTLRRSEDSFVDDLYAEAPNYGAPLLKALFPRAYLDPNREAYELDQEMFAEALPNFVNTNSPRVYSGLGTIPRVVTNGNEIYREKLSFEEANHRINSYYFPYHSTLENLIGETKFKFGKCILIDCHSMPSISSPIDTNKHGKHVDIVLGNKHGKTCAHELMQFVESHLTNLGFIVHQNHPYAGGYTTKHYGNPNNGIHTLQIEINRASYMNEETITRKPDFLIIKNKLSNLLQALAGARFNF